MKRRKFIALGGAAAIWSRAVHAQQPAGMRRIGVLMNLPAEDAESQARIKAFLQGLQQSGWATGRNVRLDYRWAADVGSIAGYASELVALAPDVIVVNANPSAEAAERLSHTIPIVFVAVTEPVGSGLVESMARPGGNATGFASAEFGTSGKWLELLKEIAPHVTRAAVLQDPTSGGTAQFAAIQSVAGSYGVAIISFAVGDASDIERSITAFARVPNGGLIIARNAALIRNRELIIELAMRYHLPAVYPLGLFVRRGGLVSYGPDIVNQYRLAAAYADRILKGEKPGDLPVQAPTKYELLINLKNAKALGLDVPAPLLVSADEVIE